MFLLNTMSKISYTRPQAAVLAARFREPRRHIQIVAGARQVGRSTLVQQVVSRLRLVWGLDGTNNGLSGKFNGDQLYLPTPMQVPGGSVGAGGSLIARRWGLAFLLRRPCN